jgi:hypothetical protein
MTDLRHMSRQDFVWFGIFQQAYIKAVQEDGATLYAIHAADGSLLVRISDRLAAGLIVREQFSMDPVSVH